MFLGIDASKNTLDVALLGESAKPRHKIFANNGVGHAELLRWLEQQSTDAVHACLEATGTWADAVSAVLHEAGHKVCLVNPAQIHAFGRSGLKRTKTDKADAVLIARFCQMYQPPAWTPLSPQLQQLQGLVRRLEHLEEMSLMEENRLASGGVCGAVKDSLEDHIAGRSYRWKIISPISMSRSSRHGDRSKTILTRTPTLKTKPGCWKAFPASVPRRLLCFWRSWVISLSLTAPVRWRLSLDWCPAFASRAPQFAGVLVFLKSAHHD